MATSGVEVMACCRPGHRQLEEGDTAITVCETCSIIIQENRPKTNIISLAERIDATDRFPFPDYHKERITVQDCYRAKGRAAERAAVRNLLKKMNLELQELPGYMEEINFDGGWLFEAIKPANRKLAPKRFSEIEKDIKMQSPEETKAYLEQYCHRFRTDRIVCYCNSCLTGLKAGLPSGKKAVHLAELLFA